MKKMTCRDLFGPCDELISGVSAQEMMQNSQKHGLEMVNAGDRVHIEAMENMKEKQMNMSPSDMQQWMTAFQAKFDEWPEN